MLSKPLPLRRWPKTALHNAELGITFRYSRQSYYFDETGVSIGLLGTTSLKALSEIIAETGRF